MHEDSYNFFSWIAIAWPYYSFKTIRYAVETDIITVADLGLSTHLLQPLDVCLLHCCGLHRAKQLLAISRRLVLESPELFLGEFSHKHEEKCMLHETSGVVVKGGDCILQSEQCSHSVRRKNGTG